MIVGLTGGIGSGKSTVLHFFKELGAVVFVADVEAKKLMNNDAHLKNEIVNLFGEKAYCNGELNREYIAAIVFNQQEKLSSLNNLVHPAVRKHFKKFSKNFKDRLIIYEAAILFESGNAEKCDYVITVLATKEDRVKRLVLRDLTTPEKIASRMKNQVDDEFKIKRSHFIIHNSKLESTKIQVNTIFEMLSVLNKKCNMS